MDDSLTIESDDHDPRKCVDRLRPSDDSENPQASQESI
jgi:hypothetical protein